MEKQKRFALTSIVVSLTILLSFNYFSKMTENSGGYFHKKCNCMKHRSINRPMSSLASTCSEEADWYGEGQHVVSYTLYQSGVGAPGKFQIYVDGILPNFHQIKLLYPGWLMRIYSDVDLDHRFCPYACLDEIMWCDVRENRISSLDKVNSRIWRFMPLGDPTVDIFVSRDIDSLVIERDREVVTDWEASHHTFHCARDGAAWPRNMWAGMWGAKNSARLCTGELLNLRQEFLKRARNRNSVNLDEDLLDLLIFQKYPKDILAHDSHMCRPNDTKVPTVPFPKKRNDPYLMIAHKVRLVGLKLPVDPCPVECRPSYGKNWTYC